MARDLGHDKFTTRIIFEFIMLIIGLSVLAWLTINSVIWEKAQIFWIFGLMGTLGAGIAFLISGKGKKDIFDVPIAEEPMIPIGKKYIWTAFILLFFVTFFFLANSNYNIAAPQFQTINVGLTGDALLVIFAAWMEDIFFFALIPGLIFSIIYWLTGKFWIAVGFVVLLSPIIFTLYHLAVYGFTNQAAMTFVYIFGLEMTAMMLLLRDIMYAHVRHIGNNLGILVFRQMSFQTFFVAIFTNIWFWGVISLVIIIGIFKYRSIRN